MSVRAVPLFAVAGFVAAAFTAGSGATAAGVTWTKITTPARNLIFQYDGRVAADANTFPVQGSASAGIANVDIDCIYTTSSGRQVQKFASDVPVSGSGASAR